MEKNNLNPIRQNLDYGEYLGKVRDRLQKRKQRKGSLKSIAAKEDEESENDNPLEPKVVIPEDNHVKEDLQSMPENIDTIENYDVGNTNIPLSEDAYNVKIELRRHGYYAWPISTASLTKEENDLIRLINTYSSKISYDDLIGKFSKYTRLVKAAYFNFLLTNTQHLIKEKNIGIKNQATNMVFNAIIESDYNPIKTAALQNTSNLLELIRTQPKLFFDKYFAWNKKFSDNSIGGQAAIIIIDILLKTEFADLILTHYMKNNAITNEDIHYFKLYLKHPQYFKEYILKNFRNLIFPEKALDIYPEEVAIFTNEIIEQYPLHNIYDSKYIGRLQEFCSNPTVINNGHAERIIKTMLNYQPDETDDKADLEYYTVQMREILSESSLSKLDDDTLVRLAERMIEYDIDGYFKLIPKRMAISDSVKNSFLREDLLAKAFEKYINLVRKDANRADIFTDIIIRTKAIQEFAEKIDLSEVISANVSVMLSKGQTARFDTIWKSHLFDEQIILSVKRLSNTINTMSQTANIIEFVYKTSNFSNEFHKYISKQEFGQIIRNKINIFSLSEFMNTDAIKTLISYEVPFLDDSIIKDLDNKKFIELLRIFQLFQRQPFGDKTGLSDVSLTRFLEEIIPEKPELYFAVQVPIKKFFDLEKFIEYKYKLTKEEVADSLEDPVSKEIFEKWHNKELISLDEVMPDMTVSVLVNYFITESAWGNEFRKSKIRDEFEDLSNKEDQEFVTKLIQRLPSRQRQPTSIYELLYSHQKTYGVHGAIYNRIIQYPNIIRQFASYDEAMEIGYIGIFLLCDFFIDRKDLFEVEIMRTISDISKNPEVRGVILHTNAFNNNPKLKVLFGRSGKYQDAFIDSIKNIGELDEDDTDLIQAHFPEVYLKISEGRPTSIKMLRNISDLSVAKKAFESAKNDVFEEELYDLPKSITVSKSIYQREQRPEIFTDQNYTRFELSSNNISPTPVSYDVGKKLIHAGDGVAHTAVGASGFTNSWALISFVAMSNLSDYAQVNKEVANNNDFVVLRQEDRDKILEEIDELTDKKQSLEQSINDLEEELSTLELDLQNREYSEYEMENFRNISNVQGEQIDEQIKIVKKIEDLESSLKTMRREAEKSTIIIEQYQSDYPVVMHTLFGGNTESNFGPLNELIENYGDKELIKAWEDENKDIGNEKEDLAHNLIPIPIKFAPAVKDFQIHVEYISKIYPYLCIINTIEVAQKIKSPYIYIMQNGAHYGNIQNKKKGEKLYSIIPQLVALPEEVRMGKEPLWKIPANSDSMSKLKAAIKQILNKDDSYEFSLTPQQNQTKKEQISQEKSQKTEWVANPEKVDRLKAINDKIKELVTTIDIPNFYTPQQALKFLNENVRGKAMTNAEFNTKIGPLIRELGLISRAKLRFKRLLKIAHIIRHQSIINQTI